MYTKPACSLFPFVICVISCILLSSGSQSASTSITTLMEDNYSNEKVILLTNSSKGGVAASTSTVTLDNAKGDNKNNDVDNLEDSLTTLKVNDMTAHSIQGGKEEHSVTDDSGDNIEDDNTEEDEETEEENKDDDEKEDKLNSKLPASTLSSISVESLKLAVSSSTSSSPLETSTSVKLEMSQSTTSKSQSKTPPPSTPSTFSSVMTGVYQPTPSSTSSQPSSSPPTSTTSTPSPPTPSSSTTQHLTPKTTISNSPTTARLTHSSTTHLTTATPTTTTTRPTTATSTSTPQLATTTTPKMAAFLLESPASLAGKKKKPKPKKGPVQPKGSKRKWEMKKAASGDTKKSARKAKGKQNLVSPTPMRGEVMDAADAGEKPRPNTRKSRNKKQGPPGPQGPMGPPGPRGDPGPAGSNCSCPALDSGPPLRLQAAMSAVLTKHFGPDKDVIVPFDLELIDLADNYDNASGVFFCSIPGTYVVSVYLMSHPGSKVNARVMVNSRPVAALWADDNKGGGFYPSSSIQTISRLEFGDQVYVMLVDGGYGESWVHANYNVFTVFLLYEDSFM